LENKNGNGGFSASRDTEKAFVLGASVSFRFVTGRNRPVNLSIQLKFSLHRNRLKITGACKRLMRRSVALNDVNTGKPLLPSSAEFLLQLRS
jgi:hypothetical protein